MGGEVQHIAGVQRLQNALPVGVSSGEMVEFIERGQRGADLIGGVLQVAGGGTARTVGYEPGRIFCCAASSCSTGRYK